MPDFSRPEYASYVDLCRSLRLKRDWEDGDIFAIRGEDWTDIEVAGVGATPQLMAEFGEPIWLPQLSDWLEMLEAAGVSFFGIAYRGRSWLGEPGPMYSAEGNPTTRGPLEAHGNTREEAAARLAIVMGAVKESAQT